MASNTPAREVAIPCTCSLDPGHPTLEISVIIALTNSKLLLERSCVLRRNLLFVESIETTPPPTEITITLHTHTHEGVDAESLVSILRYLQNPTIHLPVMRPNQVGGLVNTLWKLKCDPIKFQVLWKHLGPQQWCVLEKDSAQAKPWRRFSVCQGVNLLYLANIAFILRKECEFRELMECIIWSSNDVAISTPIKFLRNIIGVRAFIYSIVYDKIKTPVAQSINPSGGDDVLISPSKARKIKDAIEETHPQRIDVSRDWNRAEQGEEPNREILLRGTIYGFIRDIEDIFRKRSESKRNSGPVDLPLNISFLFDWYKARGWPDKEMAGILDEIKTFVQARLTNGNDGQDWTSQRINERIAEVTEWSSDLPATPST